MAPTRPKVSFVLAVLAVIGAVAAAVSAAHTNQASPATLTAHLQSTRHFEYVLHEGSMWIYDIDHANELVQQVELPRVDAIRGAVASPRTKMLYVSFGGDGGGAGNGSLLAYDLVHERVLWRRDYAHGIDSMAITPNGRTIYLPEGENSNGNKWFVLDATSGRIVGSVAGGTSPHNTIVSFDGRRVYLAGRNSDYLTVASTLTNRPLGRIGPLKHGIRPFTINAAQTLAFTTATGFLGFQVSSIRTGKVLYTVSPSGFRYNASTFAPSTPSHGISLSPDERRLYLIDAPNGRVHVFGVGGLPKTRPRLVATIRLEHPFAGDETPCSYDCARDGWLQASRDGRYVYVGDSGDVIGAATNSVTGYLPPLANSRIFLEIDWSNGVPVGTTSRYGLGYGRRR